jgi:DnaK suppressor protein
MTRSEYKRLQAILTAKYQEICSRAKQREEIAIERYADALDETQSAAAREFTTRALEREAKLLRNVRLALDRIADGSYGTCLDCEDEISQQRLQALPWAALCITCQEHADRNSHNDATQPALMAA